MSTHIRWYAHHQDTTTHLSHLINLYKSSKEDPLALLDEIFEFKEKYIYGCVDSDENGEPAVAPRNWAVPLLGVDENVVL